MMRDVSLGQRRKAAEKDKLAGSRDFTAKNIRLMALTSDMKGKLVETASVTSLRHEKVCTISLCTTHLKVIVSSCFLD